MRTTKQITLLGQQLAITGDDRDLYFASFPPHDELADSVITAVLPLVAEDAVCLDVGANLGLYSIALSRRFPRLRMIACEPVPATFDCLRANLEANAPACLPLPVALGATDHTAVINVAEHYAAGSHFSSSGSLATVDNDGLTEIEVPVRTLDSVVDEQALPRVDLIKIDVEGFETDVLGGSAQTLKRFAPMTQIEFNSWAFTAHRQLLPQHALDVIAAAFPYVYVHERHGDRLARVESDSDRLALLRANMIHGCVDNLLCGFTELVPAAPPFAVVWQEFARTPDSQLAALNSHIEVLIERIEAQDAHILAQDGHIRAQDGMLAELRRRAAESDAERSAIYDTLSWRVTKPLRAVRARGASRIKN